MSWRVFTYCLWEPSANEKGKQKETQFLSFFIAIDGSQRLVPSATVYT